jgi:DNA-binding transcriptional MerR regulator
MGILNREQYMGKSIGIKVISTACGIVPHTIRTWESRYQVFTPTRSAGGQRLYSEKDLRRAKLIAVLLDRGYTISKIAKSTEVELQELVLVSKRPQEAKSQDDTFAVISIRKLFTALSEYKINEVALEVEHLRASVGVREFIFEIVLPVMQKIGLMVAKGNYTITQEHIVSTIIRDLLGQIALPNLGDNNSRVTLATPDGNLHELSIIIADIICRANRVSTSYLGSSHPAECLSQAVNALNSNTIIMGVVTSDKWDYQKSMIPYLKKMDEYLDHPVKIILGGASKLDFPKFKNITEIEIIDSFENFDDGLKNRSLVLS